MEEIPCASKLPDGEPCGGVDKVVERRKEGAQSYQAVISCQECREPLAMHGCFGRLNHDPETAWALYKAMVERVETTLRKTKDNKPARDQLRELINDPCGSGKSVFITGPTGTGKTFLGAHALTTIIRAKGRSCFYLPEHLAVQAWRGSHAIDTPALAKWGNSVLERARTVKVLMMDDFGQTRNCSDGALDAIEALIMHRYDAGLNMIVTTNRVVQTLNDSRGARVMSRIAGMAGGTVVHCSGDDWRMGADAGVLEGENETASHRDPA